MQSFFPLWEQTELERKRGPYDEGLKKKMGVGKQALEQGGTENGLNGKTE